MDEETYEQQEPADDNDDSNSGSDNEDQGDKEAEEHIRQKHELTKFVSESVEAISGKWKKGSSERVIKATVETISDLCLGLSDIKNLDNEEDADDSWDQIKVELKERLRVKSICSISFGPKIVAEMRSRAKMKE